MSKANSTAARFLKIGLNIEYLRGVSSVAVQTFHDLRGVPYLLENQPALRYRAPAVVAVVKSLLGELKAAELPKSLEAAEQFQPMLSEVENYLKQAPAPETVTLLDHFAERIVRTAEDVLKTLRDEIA